MERLKSNYSELESIIANTPCTNSVRQEFQERFAGGFLTRGENESSHICEFFSYQNRKNRTLFIGNHKKSGLWLIPGGHPDFGESMVNCVKREAFEETGINLTDEQIGKPNLLTTIKIENPERQKCREHFDIWYFIEMDEDMKMSTERLSQEYSKWGWKTPDEIRKLPNLPENIEEILQAIENFWQLEIT